MEELITRITGKAAVDDATARQALRIILSFLHNAGNRDQMVALAERVPGLEQYVEPGDAEPAGTLGGLGGLMGGGAMAVLGELQALGLGMGQIQAITKETVGFAREKAGDDIVNDIVGSIPGLSQFV